MKSQHDCPSPEVLIDLSYGELDPREAGPVQLHLEVCTECSLEWAALLEAQKLASDLPVGPVTPSPRVEARLVALVEAQQSSWSRLFRGFWTAVSSPVPAYQAMLGGAAIAFVVQLFILGSTGNVIVPPSQAPHAPDLKATAIRIQPVEDLSQPVPRQELEQTVDAIPPDHYAQVF
jgi:anti-sigma factor RsiW